MAESLVVARMTIQKWRLSVMRLWLWAIYVRCRILRRDFDVERHAERMADFIMRGVKTRIVPGDDGN
ncbi:hypothetical protein [Thioclava sp. GXIMD4215]|uniref:hypothetical protein n=1 Tax=Thioclava sp. GXIMD4215 TaxID=3131928 RepID=UPI0032471EA4